MTVNFSKAKKIVEKKYPNNKIIACREYEELYAFFMAPKTASSGKIFLGSTLFCVNKDTGSVVEKEIYDLKGQIWFSVDI